MDHEAALTPAQRRVITDLMARDRPRPTFDPSVSDGLRRGLETAIGPDAEALDEPLWVSKQSLGRVHQCEANYLAEIGPMAWNVATAEGEVTHRAIQLSVALAGDPTPLELIDHALGEMATDDAGSLGWFLGHLSPPTRGELRARAANSVSTFLECWPPLPASWWPRTELPVRTLLCDGRVVLSGKIDLALGRAVGAEARCLFVDLKTGGHYADHVHDLRFYALVQLLRIGVPPYRVASYYLDSANFAAEDVTEETLEIAARRTAAGVRKMIELRTASREPEVTPCPRCRYCRIRSTCDGARVWASRHDDPDA